MKNYTFSILVLILLAGLTGVYLNHFDNSFHFDDSHTIEQNPFIRDLKYIPDYFVNGTTFSNLPSNQSYRPLTSVTLALDYYFAGGYDPFYFHLSTFFWFILQAALMYVLYLHLMNFAGVHSWNRYIALLFTAFYSYHTAIAETVNYVIARSDIISTVAVIASLLIYIKWPRLRITQLHLLPMIAGTLVKPPSLMYVPILVVYILLFEEKLSFSGVFVRKNFSGVLNTLKKSLPAIGCFVVLYAFTEYMTPKTWVAGGTDRVLYILTQPSVIFHYVSTFVLPVQLSADTDWTPVTGWNDKRVLLGLLFIGALIYLIFKTSKSKKYLPVSFGLAWFFIALVPTSVVPLAEVLNDHRLYFPFVGLTIAALWPVALFIFSRLQPKPQLNIKLISLAFLLILAGHAYGTYQRNKVWDNEESLWYDVTVKSPQNGRGLMNYGLTQMEKGDYQAALNYFTKALQYTPNYYTLFINLGIVKDYMGWTPEAEADFQKAIQLNGEYAGGYYYYARFLSSHNRLDEALLNVQSAIRKNPVYLDALTLQLDLYSKAGNTVKMRETASAILKLDPGNTHATELVDGEAGSIAIQQNPGTAEGWLNLSLSYYNSGMYEKCIECCREALRLKPDYAEAYNNICAAYNEMKQWDRAIEAGKKAVALNPDWALAKNNLNWARQQVSK